jgi:hypothetical protein
VGPTAQQVKACNKENKNPGLYRNYVNPKEIVIDQKQLSVTIEIAIAKLACSNQK